MIILYLMLGILQGLTEFLPVSSSGHIVLFGLIFDVHTDILLLSIVVHLGTLISVFVCMRKQIWELLKKPLDKKMINLVLATIPTILIVFLLKDYVDIMFSGKFLVIGFFATAILLAVADMMPIRKNAVKLPTAIIMGITQGLAILPGLSRSGTTMTTGILCGADKEKATEFSFLMSIPIILGSALYECKEISTNIINLPIIPLLVAFLGAFLSGILSIKIMLKIIKNNKLIYFSYYLIALCICIVAFL